MQDEQPLIMEENGKRYRMLQVGETLEIGDEVNCSPWKLFDFSMVVERWTPVVREDDGGPMPVGYYRRPIQ